MFISSYARAQNIRMASIRRLWLNALFLLLTQGEKCCGSISTKATGSTITTTSSVVLSNSSATAAINSTVSLNSTSLTETKTCCGSTFSQLASQSTISTNIRKNSVITNSNGSTITTTLNVMLSRSRTEAPINSTASSIYESVTERSSMYQSTVSSTVVSGGTGNNGDPEPKKNLYVWQLVAIGCGAFVFVLFMIIGLLCYQNRVLRKKLNASRSYSLPIKDNGAWIDSQDIPLWQKRASAFVSENPTAEPEGAPTLTT